MKKRTDRPSQNIARILSMNIEGLLNLPCYVFLKDNQRNYEYFNDYGAKRLGFDNSKIAGKSDYDLHPTEMASIYRENDAQVMTMKHPIYVPEIGVLKHEVPVLFLSYKIPIFNEDESSVGVLGICFTKPRNPADKIDKNDFNDHPFLPMSAAKPVRLSCQENLCMYHLSKGLTTKQIARKLKISPRTIETYLDRIKNKFNCRNKAELILEYLKLI